MSEKLFVCGLCEVSVPVLQGNIHTGTCDSCFESFYEGRIQEIKEDYQDDLKRLKVVKEKHYKRAVLLSTVKAIGYKRLSCMHKEVLK